jgi:meso-butanediol dehydrogenase / (S,S)-butanediol dehydrogenase / diacetyl reductase
MNLRRLVAAGQAIESMLEVRMAKLVEGKSIIVTGGGGGIGEGIVRDLAAEGARVVVADIDSAAAERIAASIRKDKGEAVAVQVDVADRASVQAMIKEAVRAFGRLDVMFNNAGISKAGLFMEASEADWARIMGINGLGVQIGMQEAAEQMIAQRSGGKIINTASIAGKVGEAIATIYCASKACVISLTQAGAEALGEHNITVNSFCRGFVKTQLWDGLDKDLMASGMRNEPNAVDALAEERAILRRASTPQDLVGATTFLASAKSDYITGQNLMVDGGVRLI